MHRRFLVICKRSSITRAGERLVIENSSVKSGFPIRYIEAIIAMTKVSLSSEAINLLLRNNVPVFFCSLSGKVRASFLTHEYMSRNNRRLLQYEAFKSYRLKVAKRIVLLKAESVERLFGVKLGELRRKVTDAQDIDSLMGVEGSMSRKMFEEFAKEIDGCGLVFGGRSYRPPADPVNALLSLSYTLTYTLSFPVVSFLGYDPYLSFLHTKRGAHASFCSDVIEPVRPLITKRVGEALKGGLFSDADFRREGKGFYLKKEKLGKFMNWFERLKDEVISELKTAVLDIGEEMG